jgi:hypothetical protein
VQTSAGGSAEKLMHMYAHLQRLEEWLGTALYQPVSSQPVGYGNVC